MTSKPCNYVTVTLRRLWGPKNTPQEPQSDGNHCASSNFGIQRTAVCGHEAVRQRCSSRSANTGPMTTNSPILEGLLVHVSLGTAGLQYARKPGG
jgi:hypothetical protein